MRTFFFILTILLFLAANFYVIYRLVNMVPANVCVRTIVAVVCPVPVLGFFVFFAARGFLPRDVVSFLYTVSTSWLFIFMYLLIIFIVLDVVRVTRLLPVNTILHGSWAGFFSVTGLIMAIFVFGYFNYLDKRRVTLDITSPKASAWHEKLRMVVVSDMHLGDNIGEKEFADWVTLLNAEEPDIVIIAGDIVDHDVRALYDRNMAAVFRRIKSRYGVYAVLGNHEYIAGARKSMDFYEKAGIHLLRDSAALVNDSFYVVGRDDRSNRRRKSIDELTGGLDKSMPVIMVDHQPFGLDEVARSGVDIYVAGHTHYGQVWPVSWITRAMYELPHGYMRKGDTHFYVSSGIGLWGGKFRIGTRSEYVVIDLGRP